MRKFANLKNKITIRMPQLRNDIKNLNYKNCKTVKSCKIVKLKSCKNGKTYNIVKNVKIKM